MRDMPATIKLRGQAVAEPTLSIPAVATLASRSRTFPMRGARNNTQEIFGWTLRRSKLWRSC